MCDRFGMCLTNVGMAFVAGEANFDVSWATELASLPFTSSFLGRYESFIYKICKKKYVFIIVYVKY